MKDSLEEIINKILNHFKVTDEMVRSRSRIKDIAAARHCVWLAMRLEGYRLKTIADEFHCHHSSVIHGLEKAENLHGELMKDFAFNGFNEAIRDLLKNPELNDTYFIEKLSMHRSTYHRKKGRESQYSVKETRKIIELTENLIEKLEKQLIRIKTNI